MSQSKRPNIVFILSDQQRPDTLGCYGQKLQISPVLDALAASGVVFMNAFSMQPLCGPARACIQTGMYATETGCFRNGIALNESKDNLGNLFSENGYKTGYIGKWHLAKGHDDDRHLLYNPVPIDMRGGYKDGWIVSNLLELTSDSCTGYLFDDNSRVDFNKYRVDAITDFGLDFIDKFKNDPFFLTISYLEPHQQNNTDIHECPAGTESDYSDFEAPVDLLPGVGNWEKEFSKYLSCCRSIDDNVGRIINKLKALGLYENTLIVYSSDHGSHFKTRPGTYKRSCHEASIRVPLIIHGGDFIGGKRMEGMVNSLDIPVTLMNAAAINPPARARGLNLSEYLYDESVLIRNDIFVQISESELGRVIRTNRYKLHISSEDISLKFESSTTIFRMVELYDLLLDPGEHVNQILNPDFFEIRNELALLIKDRIREIENIDIVLLDADDLFV